MRKLKYCINLNLQKITEDKLWSSVLMEVFFFFTANFIKFKMVDTFISIQCTVLWKLMYISNNVQFHVVFSLYNVFWQCKLITTISDYFKTYLWCYEIFIDGLPVNGQYFRLVRCPSFYMLFYAKFP